MARLLRVHADVFSIPVDSKKPVAFSADLVPSAFVGGSENTLAKHVYDCFETGNLVWSPVVFFGSTGVGKSLLLRGIELLCSQGSVKSQFISLAGSDFVRDWVDAIQLDAISSFRSSLRSVDVFILEDIERLCGKHAAQDELVRTLDILSSLKAQVFVTAKTKPCDIHGLSVQLTSRLSNGITVPVKPPGQAAAEVLIRRLAGSHGMTIDEDLIRSITTDSSPRNTNTVPNLNRRLIEIEQQSKYSTQQVSGLAEPIQMATPLNQTPSVSEIGKRVAKYFKIKIDDLRGKSRIQKVTRARGIAMLLARRITGKSHGEIGKFFGKRDHSTVIHACRRIESLMRSEVLISVAVDELQNSFLDQTC